MISGRRGLDIGRDKHLDWTLPDPSRTISGKHCEVRYRDGGYWLYDVSTNGTYLDGQDGRLKAPHRLRNGDRVIIGQYIIGVSVEGEAEPCGGFDAFAVECRLIVVPGLVDRHRRCRPAGRAVGCQGSPRAPRTAASRFSRLGIPTCPMLTRRGRPCRRPTRPPAKMTI